MNRNITFIKDGFIELYPLGVVKKAVFYYNSSVEIHFCDGREMKMPLNVSSYQHQFGVPFSFDGSLLFFYTWENGVEAISLETREPVWKLRARHAGRIAVYDTYIIVIQQEIAVLKVDIATGEILARIGCDAEDRFALEGPYQLIDSIRGKLSVLDTRDMTVKKTYSKKDISPQGWDTLLLDAELKKDILTISGWIFDNENADKTGNHKPNRFTRVLDEHFSEGL
jgi:hypothetical protein